MTPRPSLAEPEPPGHRPDVCVRALQAWAARQAGGVPPWPVPSPLPHPWAVAYSGGADSTALLRAACTLWPGQVQAFHVHHGLQAAADAFVDHARRTCLAWGVPLHVARVQARHRLGQSPEDAARLARYAALAELAQAQGAACVLLGHHAQDQIETVLLALTRGAGVAGLAGMPERMERAGVCFGRPLLSVDARALRQALDAQRIAYVDDPSNSDPRYTRNRIRTQLLPGLLDNFPASLQTVARSASLAAQAQRVLDEVAAQDLLQLGQPPAILGLQAYSRERQANVLRHWLRLGWQAVPSQAQLDELLDQIATCRTRGHRLRLKVAQGMVCRQGPGLVYLPSL